MNTPAAEHLAHLIHQGDFSFLATGHLGLVEARQREIPLNVVIFVNGEATVTGRQPVSLDRLRELLAGYHPWLRHIADPSDRSAIR